MSTPNSAATPASAIKPTALATDKVVPEQPKKSHPAQQRKLQRGHDQQGFVEAAED